jgi:hypothetical protein
MDDSSRQLAGLGKRSAGRAWSRPKFLKTSLGYRPQRARRKDRGVGRNASRTEFGGRSLCAPRYGAEKQ